MDILMAIKPIYVDMMRSGLKRVELRKVMRIQDINRIFIYESRPTKKITAYFHPIRIDCLAVDELWERVNSLCGLNSDEFYTYFYGKNKGYGIYFNDITNIVPIGLKVMGKHPPQNYTLLTDEDSIRLLGEGVDEER